MAELIILGTPLDEAAALSPSAAKAVGTASVIIGESRKMTFRYTKPHWNPDKSPDLFFLDPLPKDEAERLHLALAAMAQSPQTAVLLSDTGMPVLFDPGGDILQLCKTLRFHIRTVPSATSWATACALSGWDPPFHVCGFLPREMTERTRELKRLGSLGAHCVLMDTPYRFEPLVSQIASGLGPKRQVFLAWEISKTNETFFWGTIAELQQFSKSQGLSRGEFVLIISR